jgi:tRNA1Val (adenine37-N6)-methyltransferase
MFHFKQFSVNQDQCAMKIGTDGVLLGAWCPIDNSPYSILDIGTGTGIIALMLAQRSSAQQIDALEIDEQAYEQATDNFENSPWNDRLFCFHAGLDEFIEEPEEEYDLIVSNPPFYKNEYKTSNEQRDLARFQDALPFEDLIEAADLLLSENGILAIIIPYTEENRFNTLANDFELFSFKISHVQGTPTAEVKRSLMAFSRKKSECIIDNLVIETQRHCYTEAYTTLTKDFYLKL